MGVCNWFFYHVLHKKIKNSVTMVLKITAKSFYLHCSPNKT